MLHRRDFLPLIIATFFYVPKISFARTPVPSAETKPLRIVAIANT